jgi:hypothetical protein
MKVLFSIRHLGFVRNFEAVLCLLAERGHDVLVVSDGNGAGGDRDLVRDLTRRYRSLTFVAGRREPYVWRELAQRIRAGLDYLLYLHPIYRNSPKLYKRVADRAPALVVRLSRLPVLRSRPGVRALTAALSAAERAIPWNGEVERLVAGMGPDVVVVTPLLLFASPQVDYVRSAKALGIGSVLCVGRWDNLTTKGAIYEVPDLVTVWNGIQREQAVAIHRLPRERVAVTGAHPYDHWFGWRASPREEFCRRVGLRSDKPFLLHACSSRFVAPGEAALSGRGSSTCAPRITPRCATRGFSSARIPRIASRGTPSIHSTRWSCGRRRAPRCPRPEHGPTITIRSSTARP